MHGPMKKRSNSVYPLTLNRFYIDPYIWDLNVFSINFHFKVTQSMLLHPFSTFSFCHYSILHVCPELNVIHFVYFRLSGMCELCMYVCMWKCVPFYPNPYCTVSNEQYTLHIITPTANVIVLASPFYCNFL